MQPSWQDAAELTNCSLADLTDCNPAEKLQPSRNFCMQCLREAVCLRQTATKYEHDILMCHRCGTLCIFSSTWSLTDVDEDAKLHKKSSGCQTHITLAESTNGVFEVLFNLNGMQLIWSDTHAVCCRVVCLCLYSYSWSINYGKLQDSVGDLPYSTVHPLWLVTHRCRLRDIR